MCPLTSCAKIWCNGEASPTKAGVLDIMALSENYGTGEASKTLRTVVFSLLQLCLGPTPTHACAVAPPFLRIIDSQLQPSPREPCPLSHLPRVPLGTFSLQPTHVIPCHDSSLCFRPLLQQLCRPHPPGARHCQGRYCTPLSWIGRVAAPTPKHYTSFPPCTH